jgi:hypothetical protein
MAYNIYHIYITNIKDNGVIEPVHIRLTNREHLKCAHTTISFRDIALKPTKDIGLFKRDVFVDCDVTGNTLM